MLRLRKLVLILGAIAALAAVLTACAVVKPGSFKASQPSGIGTVHLHFVLCTEGENEPCEEDFFGGQTQTLLAFAVPNGSTAPATITATPGPGASTITFTRNQEVAEKLSKLSAQEEEVGFAWPPSGTEVVGYLSDTFSNPKSANLEWTVDADFGLPSVGDGGSYGGPFVTALASGARFVNEGAPASRPIHCPQESEEPGPSEEFCVLNELTQTSVTDLKIPVPTPVGVYVGGKASVPFTLDYASSASPLPSFALTATTNVPASAATVLENTFTPTAVAPGSNRATAGRTVTVPVPANAKPGAYTVTLTAQAASGSTVSSTGTLNVTKPVIKLGKLKLNKGKGTATLSVTVPSPGTLTAFGKKIVQAKRKATKAQILKVTIKAKGKAKKALLNTGKVKVKAKLNFKPQSGAAVTKSRSIGLQLSP